MKVVCISIITLFLSALLFAPLAEAKKGGKGTPDAVTPAVEDVCDGESGAAYGLCNAYCEAMDCDSDDPQASEKACGRVDAKYQQMTGQIMPCEVCPCASMTLWEDMLLDPENWITGCFPAATGNQPLKFTVVTDGQSDEGLALVTAWEGLEGSIPELGEFKEFGCAQTSNWRPDQEVDWEIQTLTAPEAAACRSLLIETAEYVGFECPEPQ